MNRLGRSNRLSIPSLKAGRSSHAPALREGGRDQFLDPSGTFKARVSKELVFDQEEIVPVGSSLSWKNAEDKDMILCFEMSRHAPDVCFQILYGFHLASGITFLSFAMFSPSLKAGRSSHAPALREGGALFGL